jgi:hypothetical protein
MKRATGFLLATLLLASCASTSGLDTAAERLDRTAHRYYNQVTDGGAGPRTAEDAARLAEATRDFNRAVDSNRSRDDLRPTFDRVADQYHDLRRQVENRDPRYGSSSVAFDRLTDAYLDVDRAMNHSGGD